MGVAAEMESAKVVVVVKSHQQERERGAVGGWFQRPENRLKLIYYERKYYFIADKSAKHLFKAVHGSICIAIQFKANLELLLSLTYIFSLKKRFFQNNKKK